MDVTQADSGGTRTREKVIGAGLTWVARWSLRWLLIAGGLVLLGLVVRQTWVILFPLLLALVLASVLEPVARVLKERLRFPSALAALVTLVGALAALIGIGFALAPTIGGQSDDIAKDASRGLQQVQDWVATSDLVTQEQIDEALESGQGWLTDSASQIASGVLVGLGAVGSAVLTLVLTLVLVFFFLKDGSKFVPWAESLSGPRAGLHIGEVLRRAWATLGGFIRTQAVVSFVDAVLIGIGLVIVGVPLAVPLAILTFLGGFIPIVGAFVAGAIAVLVALVSVSWVGALVVLAIILGVQQLEGNVLQPWLQSRVMALHPVVILLSVTLGSTLFGIAGAFLAVPAAAVVAVVLRYLDEIVGEHATPVPPPDPPEEPEGRPRPVEQAPDESLADEPPPAGSSA